MLRVICPLGMVLWLAACAGGQNDGQNDGHNDTGASNQIGAPATFDTVAKPVVNVQDSRVPAVDVSNNNVDDTGIPDGTRQAPSGTGKAQSQHTPAATRPAMMPEPPPNKVSPPAPDLRQLVGMDRRELGVMLGKPSLRRTEPPAEAWQYAAGQCVLHLFLYADGVNGPYRVSHVDAVPRQKDDLSVSSATTTTTTTASDTLFQQDCFVQLLNRATAQNNSGETGKTVF